MKKYLKKDVFRKLFYTGLKNIMAGSSWHVSIEWAIIYLYVIECFFSDPDECHPTF